MKSLRMFLVCLCLVAAVRLSFGQSSEQNLKALIDHTQAGWDTPAFSPLPNHDNQSTITSVPSIPSVPHENNVINVNDFDVVASEQPLPVWTQGCDWTELATGKSNRFDCCATFGLNMHTRLNAQACWALVASPNATGDVAFTETVSIDGHVVITSAGQLDMKSLKAVLKTIEQSASGSSSNNNNNIGDTDHNSQPIWVDSSTGEDVMNMRAAAKDKPEKPVTSVVDSALAGVTNTTITTVADKEKDRSKVNSDAWIKKLAGKGIL